MLQKLDRRERLKESLEILYNDSQICPYMYLMPNTNIDTYIYTDSNLCMCVLV